MIQALSKVVHEDMKPADAIQVYRETADSPELK
jgi:hypothetical protein